MYLFNEFDSIESVEHFIFNMFILTEFFEHTLALISCDVFQFYLSVTFISFFLNYYNYFFKNNYYKLIKKNLKVLKKKLHFLKKKQNFIVFSNNNFSDSLISEINTSIVFFILSDDF